MNSNYKNNRNNSDIFSYMLNDISLILGGAFLIVGLIFAIVYEIEQPEIHPPTSDISFAENNITTSLHLEKIGDGTNRMIIQRSIADSILSTNAIILPYVIYQFQVGDINHDGKTDICLGVIKDCRFDSVTRRRLFIYGIDEGFLVPLWLGTYLGEELINFRVVNASDEALIRSLEINKNNVYLVANYHWVSFGPEFIDYAYKGGNYEQASEIFKN